MLKSFLIVLLASVPAFADSSRWLHDAASPAPSTIYALCEQGTLWFSTDAGAKQPLRALAFLDAGRAVAVGDQGLIIATADAGKTWKEQTSPTKEKLMDVAFAGRSGMGLRHERHHRPHRRRGNTWAAQKTGTSQALKGLFFLDAQHGWAVGWAGTVLRTLDGGGNWQQIKSNAGQRSLSAVYFGDAQDGWAVGFAGGSLASADGGATWKALESPVNSWLTSIAFDRQNRGYIAYDDGVLTRTDGGARWTAGKVDGRYFLSRLLAVNGTLLAMGQTSMLRQTSNGWAKIPSLVPDASLRQ